MEATSEIETKTFEVWKTVQLKFQGPALIYRALRSRQCEVSDEVLERLGRSKFYPSQPKVDLVRLKYSDLDVPEDAPLHAFLSAASKAKLLTVGANVAAQLRFDFQEQGDKDYMATVRNNKSGRNSLITLYYSCGRLHLGERDIHLDHPYKGNGYFLFTTSHSPKE